MIVRGISPPLAEPDDPHTLTANLQPGTLTLAFDEQTVLAYDRAGRLWSAFLNGVSHRRGYNGRVLAKQTLHGQRVRRWLSGTEADDLLAQAAALMRPLNEGTYVWQTPPEIQIELDQIIARAANFTPPIAAQDVQHFHSIYLPIGILPPDQYLALVLQLTEGCSFNTCTFCTFYRDRPFRIKSPQEFRAHTQAVLDYLGEALPLRKDIFLADANALAVPQKQLLKLLDVVDSIIIRPEPNRIYAFLDGFSGAKKSPQDYATLAVRGLKRVYIGLESGHDPLLRFLNKPGQAADALAAAQAIKAGGINVCVIVLVGAGGMRFANGHIWDTIEVLNAMELGKDDLIYFSEFVAQSGQPYGTLAERENIEPLSPQELLEQRRAIQSGLRFRNTAPKNSIYDIREFVY